MEKVYIMSTALLLLMSNMLTRLEEESEIGKKQNIRSFTKKAKSFRKKFGKKRGIVAVSGS